MMHCYEIIPYWKPWPCFNPWLGGAALFDCGRAALFNSPRDDTSPCQGPDCNLPLLHTHNIPFKVIQWKRTFVSHHAGDLKI